MTATQTAWIRPSTTQGHGGAVEARVQPFGHKGGIAVLRKSDDPERILVFTTTEWNAFVECVKAGEFG